MRGLVAGLLLLGIVLIVVGIAQYTIPGALIVAGVVMVISALDFMSS